MSTPQVRSMNVQKQGGETFPNPAGWVDNLTLAANTPKTYSLTTLKTNSGIKQKNVFLIFSADGPFWANFNGSAAAIPTGDTLDGSCSEYSPNQRYVDTVEGNTAISFIAAATTHISIQVAMP